MAKRKSHRKARKTRKSKRSGGKRPLSFLIKMRDKMRKNLPKLEKLIEARRKAG
jgi:hypothetical protein